MRSSDILIVDDEVGIRDLLSEILQDEGYSVALAEMPKRRASCAIRRARQWCCWIFGCPIATVSPF
ncbi:nitrogen assimilation regulatory protein NtrX [Neisseria gonorrhoeae]|uniref:Nitrogen assimilation regulatory protein NtrX n=1 Tax=Neisseria gonorrhoeae TaxID=485 RepID=A0A379B0C6_NEIGO|nr:nitrogen assimilation regulatory protein NtrX [Neisseria gonorrhoeae]